VVVTKEKLVKITELAIDELIGILGANPYFFYTENDLHCFLFNEIFTSLPLSEWQCKIEYGRTSILIHKEYPTKMRYNAKALLEERGKAKRGHFDLCIWNPEKTEQRVFRVDRSRNFADEQQTFIAVELDMIEGSSSLREAMHHFSWDLLKLSPKNEVEHGYQLIFVRDWLYGNEFLREVKNQAKKATSTVVLYVEKKNDSVVVGALSSKPFLNYESIHK
jgi:hypothetical protein